MVNNKLLIFVQKIVNSNKLPNKVLTNNLVKIFWIFSLLKSTRVKVVIFKPLFIFFSVFG